MSSLAPGIRLFNRCLPSWNDRSGRVYIFLWTFLIYTCYHVSRKPISVVKSVLHANCSEIAEKTGQKIVPENSTFCDWVPFDGDNYSSLFGTLDLVFLSAYAVSMFLSGHAADRFHLRHYLGLGSVLCGLSTIAFGLGYFFNIHSYAFYVVVQLVGGIVQATGWPAVVACMGNWFGKSKRGFFMGIWNAHTSVGNIIGSLVAGEFVNGAWGWSFVVPGVMIIISGILTYLFLLPYPEEVGLDSPERESPKKDFDYTIQSNPMDETSGLSEDRAPLLHDFPVPSTDDLTSSTASTADLVASSHREAQAVSILAALRVPGVIEYSLCLLFSKLVSYTFLFWLPNYIREAGGFDPSHAADLSAIFDLGGIVGGILAGAIADKTSASATVCVVMLVCGVPMLYIYYLYGVLSAASCVGWLIPLGLLVNGPYALITTAVSADLGTHPSLRSNARALATVTGIIDGTGSIGSALGPLLCGLLKPYGWLAVFVMLMTALSLAALLLVRRVRKEISICVQSRRRPLLDSPII